jgi:hypothetical protein
LDVHLELIHLLDEQEHIHTDVKDLADGADVVIHEGEAAVTKVGDLVLGVLVLWLNAQVVNLDEHSVSLPEKHNDVVSTVTDCFLDALGWVAHCDYVVGYIGKVEVKVFVLESFL